MSWTGEQWKLGQGTSSISPVYGSRIPLSTPAKNMWVVKCPHCGGPLQTPDPEAQPEPQPDHPVVPPGLETMWLAKLYANALLGAWLHGEESERGKMPAMACAAKATYAYGGNDCALYYIAATEGSTGHHRLHLPGSAIVNVGLFNRILEDFVSLSPPPRPEGMRNEDLILFCDPVMSEPPRDPGIPQQPVQKSKFQIAIEEFPLDFWSQKAGQMQRMRARTCQYGDSPGQDDADGNFGLLACTEQRVLLCHRWARRHPGDLTLLTGIELELQEMTVALADYEFVSLALGALTPQVADPALAMADPALPIWRRKWDYALWWFGRGGFPMHPCNTCRVALPALLCDQGAKLPRPLDVICELP